MSVLIIKRGIQGLKGETGDAAPQSIIVAQNIDDVITVADNIVDVNTAADNIAAILAAPSAAATATAQALIALSATQKWNYDNTVTMADPGSGDFRLNHATIASATAMAISAINTDAVDLRTSIAAWDDSTNTIRGTLKLTKVNAPNVFAEFNITGASTDNTTWLQLALAYVTGNGTFTNADQFVISFSRAGNAGATGAAGTGIYEGGTAAGTANALTCTASPTLASYAALNNRLLVVKASAAANTSSATINISALGVVTMKKFDNTYAKVNLVANDIPANGMLVLTRDGTDVVLLNPSTQPSLANFVTALYSGNSVANVLTLPFDPGSEDNVGLYVEGIYQNHDQFSVSGVTLTATENFPDGVNNIEVRLGTTLPIGTPSDGTVTFPKLGNALVVTAAETIAANNNDTTIPTSAAVKSAIDAVPLPYITFDPRNYKIGLLGQEPARVARTSNFTLDNTFGIVGAASGTGAQASMSGSDTLQMTTGTTTTGYCAIGANTLTVTSGNKELVADFTKPAKLATFFLPIDALGDGTNTYIVECAFKYSISSSMIDGANTGGNGFRYKHSEAGGDWQCITHNGTSSTITDTGIPFATNNTYLLEIEINSTWTEVIFKINDAVVATHTTNIYTNQRAVIAPSLVVAKQAGTNSRTVQTANFTYQLGVKRDT